MDELSAWREHKNQLVRMHPALRWVADGDQSVVHRKLYRSRDLACGLPHSELVLAEPGAQLCPACFD